jgi:hypothetical protein
VKLGSPDSIRDRLLVSAKSYKNTIEYLRFFIGIKAALLDRTDANSVNDFNDTLRKLTELESPGAKKTKMKTPDDVRNIMKDFDQSFKKIKDKLKNFKRAD